MTEEQMRSEFEEWAVDNGFSIKLRDDASSPDTYFAYETEQRWMVWQACAARMVPDAAASILADVINALENGFVRCETCGDQEDTATLDCMDDLRKIHAMIAAAPEPKKEGE